MDNPTPRPAKNRSYIVGGLLTVTGLILILGAAWFAFSGSANEAVTVSENNSIASAEITPLPDLDQILAEDDNLVQVSTSGFIYPVNFRISEIDLDLPVVIVGLNDKKLVTLPTDSVGFWDASTTLSANGNSVLVGHNNLTPRKVFWSLEAATVGMAVQLTSQFGKEYAYTIEEIEIIQVEGANESDFRRIADLMKLEDGRERLTIVSCYPAGSCAQRIVLIAKPSSNS